MRLISHKSRGRHRSAGCAAFIFSRPQTGFSSDPPCLPSLRDVFVMRSDIGALCNAEGLGSLCKDQVVSFQLQGSGVQGDDLSLLPETDC